MDLQQKARSPGDLFYARTFALLTLFVVGYLLYQLLLPLLVPLLWAIFIAFLLQPPHRWLTGHFHCNASLSALLLTLATLLILIGPLAGLVAAFAAQVANLLEAAQTFAGTKLDSTSDLLQLPVLGGLLRWIQVSAGISWAEIQEWTATGARAGLRFLAPFGGRLFLGALETAVSFVITMFVLFFFIRDGRRMAAVTRGLIPMSQADKSRLFGHLAGVLRAVVYGTGLTALMQGALVGIGFWILGLPAPLVFGALATVFALIPAAGTPVVWVPAAIVLAAQQRWGAAIFLVVWGLLLSTLDNFVRPYLVSGRADVGTLAVFVGVLGGIAAFGPIGLFAGPFILALVVALIRFTLEMRALHFGDPQAQAAHPPWAPEPKPEPREEDEAD
jgi:predicted PurR-regulated permease PerM